MKTFDVSLTQQTTRPMKQKEPIVEFFSLEGSQLACEWMDENGNIYDIKKFARYLNETFNNPLEYVLETFNDALKEGNLKPTFFMESLED